ncbi:uncharacterized protein LOC126840498 isoform X1 [Adelges cooleyi]|uniref:uncharacterized protein LOC126840498 isoform X1 n=1 Tax=Adelges cooleyi TaxID=133065 RepID=UPI00217F95EC|nr:uncharacterized protein LOC126840498 isoform X1 [Adelges cooleyi]
MSYKRNFTRILLVVLFFVLTIVTVINAKPGGKPPKTHKPPAVTQTRSVEEDTVNATPAAVCFGETVMWCCCPCFSFIWLARRLYGIQEEYIYKTMCCGDD